MSFVVNKSSGTIYHVNPKGVSIMDGTNSKSSGTSSGAWTHRLRAKGWNYNVSPEGVSIKDDTKNDNQIFLYAE